MAVAYRKFYDAGQARRYGEKKAAKGGTHLAECRLAARALAGVPRDQTIVYVPCGTGRMTFELVRLGFKPAAADVSPAMVELARAAFEERGIEIAVEVQDLEATTWPDRAFDNVFSFRFFHHLPTPELQAQVARELCRIAAKRVLVSYLDSRAWTARRRAFETLLRDRKPGKHTLRPGQMRALFEEQGFRVVADMARFPFLHSLRVLVAER